MVNHKPLLLLHGALGSAKSFDKLREELKLSNLYSFDFSGHGSKPTQAKLTFDLFANDIKEFVELNDIKGCDVFGFSMGGYAALYTALHYPDLLGDIYTLGTKMLWTPEISAQEVRMLNPDKMLEKIPKFAEYLQSQHGSNWSNLVHQTAALMADLGNGKALKETDLQGINNRVVVGLGSLDKMVTAAESNWAVQYLPNSTFVELHEVEHPIEKVNLVEVLTALFNASQTQNP